MLFQKFKYFDIIKHIQHEEMAGREIMSNKLKINYRISKKNIGKVNNSFKISYQKFYEALNLLIKSRKLLIDNFN